jgi:hypothetical protein
MLKCSVWRLVSDATEARTGIAALLLLLLLLLLLMLLMLLLGEVCLLSIAGLVRLHRLERCCKVLAVSPGSCGVWFKLTREVVCIAALICTVRWGLRCLRGAMWRTGRRDSC